jgi:hypothetical protein
MENAYLLLGNMMYTKHLETRENLFMRREVRAVSTTLTILLILVSLVFGAAISYMWVMANFYNIPENTTLLSVEEVAFPTDNFTYFNVTILNPSYSLDDANVTAFRLSVEGEDIIYTVEIAEPGLPFLVRVGAKQSFTCIDNWSNIAGQIVRIEPVAENASIKSFPYATPSERLDLLPDLDVYESVQSFNLTIENAISSVANLTISSITVSDLPVDTDPQLPSTSPLQPGDNQTYLCYWNWEDRAGQNATIAVTTTEGYETNYTTYPLPGAFLHIDTIDFDYTNTTYFNVTVKSVDSTAPAFLDSVNLTLLDNTTITLDTVPTLKLLTITVPANESLTLICLWNWTEYRDQNVTVNVYTKQGFTVPSKINTTPSDTVWTLDDVKFDLDDVEHFSVTLTNKAVSLQQILVTKVMFDPNDTAMNSTVIAPGDSSTIQCGFNWRGFVGENVTITVYATEGLNETSISRLLQLPHMKITNVSFSNFPLGNPYFNVTIINSEFSTQNSVITQVLVTTDNVTFSIDGTITSPNINQTGYNLQIDSEITIVCPWDWSPHFGKDITVVVETAEGLQLSKTLKVE